MMAPFPDKKGSVKDSFTELWACEIIHCRNGDGNELAVDSLKTVRSNFVMMIVMVVDMESLHRVGGQAFQHHQQALV